MRFSVILLIFCCVSAILGLNLSSCTSKPKDSEPAPKPKVNSDSTDLGVFYNKYIPGNTYSNDTIRFDFKITNFDSIRIATGSKVQMACKFDTTVFALDLIGRGPTSITVPYDLNKNDSFNHNSGYLLGNSILAYFAVDSIDITLMVYGIEGSSISEFFPKDKNPINNKATLRIKSNKIIAK